MPELAWLSIVGIGEDGIAGITASAKIAIERAEILVGGARHLDLVPESPAQRIAWPSPMMPFVPELIATYRGRKVCVLASGDPMLYGVGTIFAKLLSHTEYRVYPAISAISLACARLGWPIAEVALISAVARPLENLLLVTQPKRRVVVYSQDGDTPSEIATLLTENGYGASFMQVFEHLGGPREVEHSGTANAWDGFSCDDLNVVAITCVLDEGADALSRVPGLADGTFDTDGQLTKREVRAVTLARLAPLPGELLWDVGAGTGSIGIEWMRTHASCNCIAFEEDAVRAQRIARNARRFGVPALRVVAQSAPAALRDQEAPDAVFVGGGVDTSGVFEACWQALRPGGRLVANVVTLEGEMQLAARQREFGGDLTRIAISRIEPIGSMRTWRPQLPVTQWIVRKR